MSRGVTKHVHGNVVIDGDSIVKGALIIENQYIDIRKAIVASGPENGTRRLFVDPVTQQLIVRTHSGEDVFLETGGGSGIDPNAIHGNALNEIKTIASKTSPSGSDVILIEDSAASWAKKGIEISSLPSGSPSFGTPTGNIDIGDSNSEGSEATATRSDHQHAFTSPTAGYPLNVAETESDGGSATPARSDHVHAHGSGYLPDAHHTRSHALNSGSDHSGDLDYSQLDTIVAVTGGGSATTISRADHLHTASDGSSKITYSNLLGIPSTFAPASHAISDAIHTGDLLYAQIDSLVASTGGGSTTTISRADHVHTGSDGSTKVAYSNLSGVPGSFVPSAHAIDITSGFHTGSLPLGDLAAGTRGSVIRRGSVDWEELVKGTLNYVLKAGATDVAWGQVDHGELSGVTADQHHAQSHGSSVHTGSIFPAANQSIGAYYVDITGIVAPAVPGSGTRRIFVDTADGILKVMTSGGSSISLEAGGSGGGDNITVNGVACTDADFDDATPVAPSGRANVKWQRDSSTPNNVSAYISFPQMVDAFRKMSFWANEFLVPNVSAMAPFYAVAISSGTFAVAATSTVVTKSHPGVCKFVSSTTTNSGWRVMSDPLALLLGGGESFEFVFNIITLATSTFRFGFIDTITSADCVDGAYLEVASTGVATGKTSSNSTRSSTGTTYTLSAATWYRMKIVVNADATRIDFYIYNDAGSELWTNNLTTNIPTGTGRETGVGVIATNSGTTAVSLVYCDYMAYWGSVAAAR